MRVLATIAIAAAILLATASGSFVGHKHTSRLFKQVPHQTPVKVHPHDMHKVAHEDNVWGQTYRLTYDLGLAIVSKNWTWADSLLDDNALILVDGISCGMITKAQFIANCQSNPAAAEFFNFGSWAGYQGGLSIFEAQTAAVTGPSGAMANTTIIQPTFFFALANLNGTKLVFFEQITDRSWAQSNATAMVNEAQRYIDAARLLDISVWQRGISDTEFNFAMLPAFNQFPVTSAMNKTSYIQMLEASWANQSKVSITVERLMVVCDHVAMTILWSGIDNSGRAYIQRFVIAMGFDAKYKMTDLQEYALMPFF